MRPTLAAVLAFSSFLTLAGAREARAVNLGPLKLNPYVEAGAYYDDNVFVQSTNEVDDWYFLISPGVLFQLLQRDNLFEVEYKADIYRYIDTDAANDVEDQYLRGAAYFNFPGGLSIKLDELASKGHEPRSESNLAVTGVTALNRFYSSDAIAEVSYELSERFRVAAAYRYFIINYKLDENDFRDRNDNGVGLTLYYKFLPKTSVLLEGVYKDVYHTENSSPAAPMLNSDEYWVMAGLTWDITDKSTGTVKGGYEWKKFEFPGKNDFRSPVYQVILDHNFTSKTSVTVSGTRQANETDDPAVSYYTTSNGAVEFRLHPIRKVEIKPYGSYTHNRYSGATTAGGQTGRRLEDIWVGGIDVSYSMNKYLALTLGYKYTERSSTLDFYDYEDNLAKVQLRASL